MLGVFAHETIANNRTANAFRYDNKDTLERE